MWPALAGPTLGTATRRHGTERPAQAGGPPAPGQASGAEPTAPDQLGDTAERASLTYGAAADHYSLGSLAFWDRFGASTVARLQLRLGERARPVLRRRSVAIPAAGRAVGPGGRVLGVDVAGPLLELARAKAAAEGLANIEFRLADATSTGLPDGSFDAVVCVFGVFFARDMTAFVAEMWRLVRPGGVLAITTWGPGRSSLPTDLLGRGARHRARSVQGLQPVGGDHHA